MKWYCSDKLRKIADENDIKVTMCFGKRSNGKSFDALKIALENYILKGEKFVYVRKQQVDTKTWLMSSLFSNHKLSLLSREAQAKLNGEEPEIKFYNSQFKFNGEVFGVKMELSTAHHAKGFTIDESYSLLIFDEFMTENCLVNEFSKWQSILSTCARSRTNLNIMMIGNTIQRTNTYFSHYHIDIDKLEQGKINIVTIKQKAGEFKIAIEWCDDTGGSSGNTSLYFVQDDEADNMISDGKFESIRRRTEINGVTYNDWYRAKKLPFSFFLFDRYLEFRIFNNVLLTGITKNPSDIVICHIQEIPKIKGNRMIYNIFPFIHNQNMSLLETYVINCVRCNNYIPKNLAVGSITDELVMMQYKQIER